MTIAVRNKIELTGVRRFGSSRANHAGKRLSQPAVIGSRVSPVSSRLAAAMARAIKERDGERHGLVWPACEFPSGRAQGLRDGPNHIDRLSAKEGKHGDWCQG